VTTHHENGKQIVTDMPREMGGSGDQVTPGWLFRAGFAACTATCIGLAAVGEGIELAALEVQVRSRSDTRGLLGLPDAGGDPVPAGPQDVQMLVRIAAQGVSATALRAVVQAGYRSSPMACAMGDAVPVALSILVDESC
jgi:uncharacterized OsmC-like protein